MTTVIWRGVRIGDSDEDSPQEMAQRMVDCDRKKAVQVATDLLMESFEDDMDLLCGRLANGNYKGWETVDFLAAFLEDILLGDPDDYCLEDVDLEVIE